jgi:hypothetical protein
MILILVAGMVAGWSMASFAQFDSGSDGSYGPINVTSNQNLLVPDDGIFHATTVVVNGGRSLTFTKNAANTPVYILATGDVTINGTVHVTGKVSGNQIGGEGGPGGFDGGARSVGGDPPGDGHGPGGGKGGLNAGNEVGSGSFGTVHPTGVHNGAVYGTALMMPMVGGSGGGGSDTTAGGGGGGAITIASNTQITLVGSVFAHPGSVLGNGDGSSGAVRLVAPKVAGSGNIYVDGVGGLGRVRVDLIDRSEYNINIRSNPPHVIGSLMQVFPTTTPSLAIIEAAGEAIPEGSTTPVDIFLADGTPSTQNVVVQARDFTGLVPIRVMVTPDSGDSVAYDDTIDMGGGNPSSVTVAVQIPVNIPVNIEAWTTDP